MTFGVGVIGATGFIGTPYRAEIRECSETARIVALCARRRDRLDAAAVEDGCEFVTADWREVVEHPDVNLVLVLTPDALHLEPVLAAAAAGKHVFCEKPVGANVEEAYAMWSAVRGAGVAHYVPFWTRYAPSFIRARELVADGVLGEIRGVFYRWHNPRPEAIPHTWRDDAELSSAGSIADVGSHAYDAVCWILGCEARRVLAHADVISPPKPDLGAIDLGEAIDWGNRQQVEDAVERKPGTAFDYATIAWEFSNDAIGAIILSHASTLRKGLSPELEIHGTLASLAIDRINNTVTVYRSDDTDGEVEQIEDSGFGNRAAQHVFVSFQEQVAGTRGEHPGIDDGWRVQIFTDAAALSARRSRSARQAMMSSSVRQ
ncbi:MAG: Gfo/Idh/MocA family oxidoreductase [Planctomycetaceae bacterium]